MDREGRSQEIFTFILIISVAFIVGGCDYLPLPFGKKSKEQKKVAATVKSPPRVRRPVPPPPPLPSRPKKEEPRYVYDPVGKRDPFLPFVAMQTPVKPSGEKIRLTPLQKYDVSQLKLVAILVGTKGGKAMVEDSEGKGFIVEKGTYIGSNFGKVKAILKDEVIIEEKYKDYLGNVRSKEVVLKLHVPLKEERRP